MPSQSTLRILILLLLPSPLLACTQTQTQPSQSTPDNGTLPIVHTWNDLLAQPIVGTGDEAVHLGIESTTCDENTAVLVYCIPVDQSGSRITTERMHNPLGPVAIKIIPLDRHEEQLKYAIEKENRESPNHKEPQFFAVSAPVGIAGRYEIKVLDKNEKMLAAAEIVATKSIGSPWLTFFARELSKEPGSNVYALSQVAARPKWDGAIPNENNGTLPHFYPTIEDPTLDLSMKNGIITVNSEHWLIRYLDDNWLIRWWVNGKPVLRGIRKRAKPGPQMAAAEQIIEPLQFSFLLNLDPAEIGATPKDKIEFQLLYCRDGIEFLDDNDQMKKEAMKWNPLPPGTRLSKRIPWQP